MLFLLAQAANDVANGHGPDHGPVYTESNFHAFISEPWSVATNLAFLAMAIYWLVRLRGRYRQFLFLTCCMGGLLVGWLGGSVYHAFRAHWIWLAMDIFPIITLCIAGAVYLWLRVLPKWWYTLLIIPPFILFQRTIFWMVRAQGIQLPRNIAIGLSYATQAMLVFAPALLVLWKNRWRDWYWPALGVASFLVALWARATDANPPAVLAGIGTHWLWHLFGAGAAFCVSVYFYRLRREELQPGPATAAS